MPSPRPGSDRPPRPTPAGPPAHPSSFAPGQCCWAQGRRHPPRCNCRCSRHPRPGRSSAPPPPPLQAQTISRARDPSPEHLRPGEGSAPHRSLALGATPPITGSGSQGEASPWGRIMSSQQTVHAEGAKWGLPCAGSAKVCKSVPVLGITQELGF